MIRMINFNDTYDWLQWYVWSISMIRMFDFNDTYDWIWWCASIKLVYVSKEFLPSHKLSQLSRKDTWYTKKYSIRARSCEQALRFYEQALRFYGKTTRFFRFGMTSQIYFITYSLEIAIIDKQPPISVVLTGGCRENVSYQNVTLLSALLSANRSGGTR